MIAMMLGYGFGVAGLLWMFGGLLLTVGVVVLIIWALTGLARGGRSGSQVVGGPASTTSGYPGAAGSQAPLEILRERYARGEINEEEFERAKKVLGY